MPVAVSVLTDVDDPTPYLAVRERVYRNDACALPTDPASARANLNRADFAGRQLVLLGRLDGLPAAHLVARCPPALRDDDGAPLGTVGAFESVDHPELADALFREAFAWFAARGVRAVLGPMDGDTWHSYRFQLGPAEPPPFLKEPYQPAYYPALWERQGFAPVERYLSKIVHDLPGAAAATAPVAERWLARGGRLRPLRRDALPDELATLHRLSCAIFAANRFYTPISLAEFLTLYDGVEPLLVDGLNWFALDAQGRETGFVFAYPDLFRAVRAMRGRRDPLARLRFQLERGRADAVCIKSLGVLPERQGTGAALALMHQVYVRARERGCRRALLCLIREGNSSARMDGGLGEVLRTYALYRREL